jgi:hypothetical protein
MEGIGEIQVRRRSVGSEREGQTDACQVLVEMASNRTWSREGKRNNTKTKSCYILIE